MGGGSFSCVGEIRSPFNDGRTNGAGDGTEVNQAPLLITAAAAVRCDCRELCAFPQLSVPV